MPLSPFLWVWGSDALRSSGAAPGSCWAASLFPSSHVSHPSSHLALSSVTSFQQLHGNEWLKGEKISKGGYYLKEPINIEAFTQRSSKFFQDFASKRIQTTEPDPFFSSHGMPQVCCLTFSWWSHQPWVMFASPKDILITTENQKEHRIATCGQMSCRWSEEWLWLAKQSFFLHKPKHFGSRGMSWSIPPGTLLPAQIRMSLL